MWLNLTRELYNAALQERRDAWQKQKIQVTVFDQMRAFPAVREVRPEFSTVPIVVQRGAIRRLDRAFQGFFRRCKTGEKPGYPRFRGKHSFGSISIDDVGKTHPIVAGGKRVAIPKLGKVKFKQHRLIDGRPKAIRVKRECGKWYVIFACADVAPRPLPPTGKEAGIDLGLLSLVATSDGVTYENPRALRAARIRLERAQRRVTRKKRGSHRRRKAAAILRKVHARVANIRRQNAIDVSRSLISQYDVVYVEKLNVKGMARGCFAKSIHDAGWSTLLHWLNVKAESAGREIVAVDPRGTSQECSGCGARVEKTLAIRVHDCRSCGLRLDRDVNAALNVRTRGQRVRRDATVVEVRL